MNVGQMPLLSALAGKMKWHEARQSILAENVANADTPGYRGKDLQAFTLDTKSTASVATLATNPMHFSAVSRSDGGDFGTETAQGFAVTPEGNEVTLEDEMMKVTGNQMDFQAVTTLYQRSLRLLRTALGRSA